MVGCIFMKRSDVRARYILSELFQDEVSHFIHPVVTSLSFSSLTPERIIFDTFNTV